MYCKHCGKEMEDDARFCPGCGKQTSEKVAATLYTDIEEVKKHKKHKKNGCIIWIIAGILLGVGCNAISDEPSSSQTTPTSVSSTTAPTTQPTTAPTEEPVIDITPAELYNAYEENEVAADNLYDGKKLRITGVIESIGKDILDDVYITIDAGDYNEIQCYFENEKEIEKVAALKTGDEITLVGECSGISILNVIMRNCEIE